MTSLEENADIYQVLMVGAGDPRHILKMLSEKKTATKIKIYVLEAQVEIYARMILLIGICLRKDLGLQERSMLLLDIWGNLTLRPTSKTYLDEFARIFANTASDPSFYTHLAGIVSAVKLKYKERDILDGTFKSWYTLTNYNYNQTQAWDVRLRQLYKNKYDNRQAEADWGWHMRLKFRLEKLFDIQEVAHKSTNLCDSKHNSEYNHQRNPDGYVGVSFGWGKEFLEWRNSGLAFDLGEQSLSDLPNTSLASVAIVSDGIRKLRRVGYWGDVLGGPFPSLAMVSTEKDLIKLENGRSKYSGTHTAKINLEHLLVALWKKHDKQGSSERSKSKIEESENCETQTEKNGKDDQWEKRSTKNENSISKDPERDSLISENLVVEQTDLTQGVTDMNVSCEDALNNGRLETKISNDDISKNESQCGNSISPNDTNSCKDFEKGDDTDQSAIVLRTATKECKENTIKPNEEDEWYKNEETGACSTFEDNGYLRVEGFEVILLSPTRLNELEQLSEVNGYLDTIYLSAAMAHHLTPQLAKLHVSSNTTVLVENASMMPELTDEQVAEYKRRITASARKAGWFESKLSPACHLTFKRKENIQ